MELWKIEEAAKQTRTSVALWRKLIRQKKVPVVRIGRCVRLDPEHVRAYIASRTQRASVSEPPK